MDYAPFRRDLNSLLNDVLQLSYLQSSLLLHAQLDWTEGREIKLVSEKSVAALWH